MKKLLKKNSLLGAFQLQGIPEEQETLNKLVKEVLNTKSGRQLVEDVLASDFVHKPINLAFVPQEKLDNWAGTANAKKGICLSPISKDDTKDQHSHFLDKACALVHELHHLKIAEDFYTPLPGKRSITQVIYSGLTNEACTYTFECCVFGKELKNKYPDFIKLDLPDFPSNQAELIEAWLQGRYKDRNRVPLVAKYLDMYLNTDCTIFWYPAKDEKAFFDKIARFQRRSKAIPLESFPWYKPRENGGYYIIGRSKILEVDKTGAPVYFCHWKEIDKVYSIVYSRKQREEEKGMTPQKFIRGIFNRPILPCECNQAQDYLDGKISKDDLPDLDEDITLPKTVRNMTDVVAWRESFIPTKTPHKTKITKPSKDPKKYE